MTKRHLIIATRESPLAMRQAELIKSVLIAKHPHLDIEFLGLTTEGDRRLGVSLREVGGKGLFVKELEEALLAGKADIAVHSMKDVPMELPAGLSIPVMGEREDVRDAFVSNRFQSLIQLPANAIVGTSSLRRQMQIKALRADTIIEDLRGNVNTRLKRLDANDFDAIILAAAGLKRLDLASRIRSYLSVEECVPAAGQGALGIECRTDDEKTLALIQPLNNENTFVCVTAERALCKRLQGGCQVPVAAFAHIQHGILKLQGLVAGKNGIRILRVYQEGKPEQAENIGKRAAEELLQQGAEKILREFHE